MAERVTNSFEGGLSNDLDPKISKSNTYNLSINGKLLYNENGTLSWQNADGNVLITSLPNGYTCLGHCNFATKFVLFLYSESSGFGKIIVCKLNPNNNSISQTSLYTSTDFNFNSSYRIKAVSLEESSSLNRVYFTDDYNEPRSFTFKDENGTFTAVTPSVAAMSIGSNFNIGIIKLKSVTKDGSLLSGKYQYTYRCVSEDGYQTPWIPVTRHFVINSNDIPSGSSDSNEFGFGSTEQPSGKSINLQIEKVDTRFKSIQVAFLYSKTNATVESASIFYDELINGQSTIVIKHSSITNSGVPVEITTISDRKESIIKAKEIFIKDNRLWLGNTETTNVFVLPDSVLSGLQVKATFRAIQSDNNSINSLDNSNGLPISGSTAKTSYTHRLKYTTELGVPFYESYDIVNDFTTFRGTQVEHLYSGYFRDEKYRFGIVFFDKKGNPLFATHLADVKFPSQFQNNSTSNPTLTWERLREDGTIASGSFVYNISSGEPYYKFATSTNYQFNTIGSDLLIEQDQYMNVPKYSGTYPNIAYARTMGVMFSGIDITDIQDKVSGFQIVRVPRDEANETIKMQGIINQCVYRGKYQEGTVTNIVAPFPNAWVPSLEIYNSNFYNQKLVDILCGDTAEGEETDESRLITLAPQYYTIDFPDYMITQTVPSINKGTDKIKIASTAFSSYSGQLNQSYINWTQDHHIHKFYNQQNTAYFQQPGQTWSNSTRGYYNESYSIDILMSVGWDKPIEGSKYFSMISSMGGPDNSYPFKYYNTFTFSSATGEEKQLLNAMNFPYSLFAKLDKPFILFDHHASGTTPSYRAGQVIVNLKREISAQYGGLSKLALQNNIFETTGHYQEINSQILVHVNTSTGRKIFNNVEVFGGDCYVDFFGYCRLMPSNRLNDEGDFANISEEESVHDMNIHDDYSVAAYVPIESKYNLSMRLAEKSNFPIHASVGTKTTKYLAGEDPSNTKMANGIYYPRGNAKPPRNETFNVNSILFHKHNVYNFFSQPSDYIAKFDFPTRWHWSNEKKPYSEKVDRFREFEELSNFDLDASYGEIVGSALLANNAYSIQRNAFGKLRINERAVVSANEGQQVTLGEPTLMNGIDYISKTFGTQHQYSVYATDRAIYWADALRTKLLKFGQDGLNILSDIGNIHSFIAPYLNSVINKDYISTNSDWGAGIITYYDYENNDVFFTIRPPYTDNTVKYLITDQPTLQGTSNALTISYNEDLNVFHSEYTFYPKFAFSYGNKLMTQNYNANNNDLYLHTKSVKGKYYEKLFYSLLGFNINKYPNITKIFDTGSLNIGVDSLSIIDKLYLKTDNNEQLVNIGEELVNNNGYSTSNRAHYKLGNLKVPYREKNILNRLNGNFLNFKLVIKNADNKVFNLTSVDSIFRIQKRM